MLTLFVWMCMSGLALPDDPDTLPNTAGLPLSLGEDWVEAEAQDHEDKSKRPRHLEDTEFSLGPVAGYIRARGADHGTWFGGVQARLRFLRYLAVEGSISFHQDEYLGGDVRVTTYPVQVSALLLPFPDSKVEPYLVMGAGWYYQRFDYDDALLTEEETHRSFGVHLGAGVLFELGKHFVLFGDFRWIFMDESGVDNSQLEDEEFDSRQITLGGSFRF